jgi:hypothetical protein
MIMDLNVVALPTGRPMMNLTQLVIDFAAIGLFHTSYLRGILTHGEVVEDVIDITDAPVVDFGSGWVGVNDLNSVALTTMFRIAAVTEDRVIPYADIANAIIKMAEWGPDDVVAKDRKAIAKRWGEYFEVLPSNAAISGLASFVGATDTGKGVDFSSVSEVIEPTELERAVLDAIEMQYDFCAPSSRLCREARKRLPPTSKLTVDYRTLKRIPFILKPEREYNRLVGFEPDARLVSSVENAGMTGLIKSTDGLRVIVEYLVSEENVEGNSFNVQVDAKPVVAGSYLHQATGTSIALNTDTKFAQKLTGIGAVIREVYPNYVNGQKCFVMLDKVNNTAEIELINAGDIDREMEIKLWIKGDVQPAA